MTFDGLHRASRPLLALSIPLIPLYLTWARSSKSTDCDSDTSPYSDLDYGCDLYVKNPKVEDLPVLYEKWQSGSDVWPWVWCQRNENGPHHVFVMGGVRWDEGDLKSIEQRSRDNVNNNIVVVVKDERAMKESKGMEWFLQRRCAVIEGTAKFQHEEARLLMLEDERIIAYDSISFLS